MREFSHVPIPHDFFFKKVYDFFVSSGYSIGSIAHSVNRQDKENPNFWNQYFGIMQLHYPNTPSDYDVCVGIRNSHDKSFPAELVLGSVVFVCDNLAFRGDIKVFRRHTSNIFNEIDKKLAEASNKLSALKVEQDERFVAYKDYKFLNAAQVHDTIIRMVDSQVMPVTYIPRVLAEWRNEEHPQFEDDKSMWRLFNHFTEVGKDVNLMAHSQRTSRLSGLFDSMVGFNAIDIPAEVVE